MPFSAKSGPPIPNMTNIWQPVLERAGEGGITLFSAPPGYLSTDHLSGVLFHQNKGLIWLRLGPEDRDPGSLLKSLIHSARRYLPGLGDKTLDLMTCEPGTVAGWAGHFASLAHEWREQLSTSIALVIQNLEVIRDVPPLLDLLAAHFLPAFPAEVPRILISTQPLARHSLPGSTLERGSADLRLDGRGARVLTLSATPGLTAKSVTQVIDLSGGRVCAILDLLEACQTMGEESVLRSLDQAIRLDQWMAKLARSWLSSAPVDALQAVALILRLGYSHPSLVQVALGETDVPPGPWLQKVSGGWSRIHQVWRAPLERALRAGAVPEHTALHRAAEFLAAQGAAEQAVPVFFELGDLDAAAEAIARSSEEWMAHGQWQMLGDWLAGLPVSILGNWPWLVYYSGEIITSQGRLEVARRTFSAARKLFEEQANPEGQCRAMLAENTLAAWQNDLAFAQKSALSVLSLAEDAGLDQVECWACWQAGCLAVLTNRLENAVEYFARASDAARKTNDDWMIALCRQAEGSVRSLRELQAQSENYRQAYFDTQRASHEAAQQLHLLLSDPLRGFEQSPSYPPALPSPLLLTISKAHGAETLPSGQESSNILSLLLGAFGMLRRRWARQEMEVPKPGPDPSAANPPYPTTSVGQPIPWPAALADQAEIAAQPADFQALPVTGEAQPDVVDAGPPEPAQIPGPAGLLLSAHLLGPLSVSVNDQHIERWPSAKCRAVFSYLLAHHAHPIPRDVLMDVLWPDASLKAARNNLNVALYSLRRTLRSISDANLVVHEAGAYCLAPAVQLWLDIDEFERHVQEGRVAERKGRRDEAIREYESAAGIYQGDFLSDDPYEEWPVTMRQNLRLAYQEILDRLGQFYFLAGQYTACVSMCQILLSYDNCREDIHCRLMRCYSRQGLDHLALRQFQVCSEALRVELEVTPSLPTSTLYEQIRRHEAV